VRAAKATTKALPTIVTPHEREAAGRPRRERVQQADAEPSPEVVAFFARDGRPRGPMTTPEGIRQRRIDAS
jgi:hypothetical protein